jgi:D-aminopeptidase
MIVLATDAPLSAHSLERLAKRAVLALGRVGSFMSNGSGDFVVAFSTAQTIPHDPPDPVLVRRMLADDALSPLFLATVEAVEAAILDSLLTATTVTGRDGHTAEAIPLDDLRRVLRRHGRIP